MPSTLKSILIVFLFCVVALSVQAQSSGRAKPATRSSASKPPAGTTEAEQKDASAVAQNPERAAELFEAGQNAHQAGRLAEAAQHYNEALRLDASLWQAAYQLAAAYLSLNRLPEAEAAIDRVIAQLAEFPDSPEARAMQSKAQLTRGEIMLGENKLVEAETAFKRVLETDPEAPRAQAGLARVYFADNKTDEAIRAATAALKAGDEQATTYALLGAAWLTLRRYDEALASLNEALKRDAQQAAALRYRAEIFLLRKDYQRAVTDLQAALAIEKNTAATLRLAEVYAQSGRPDEAVKIARQVLAAEPDNSAAQHLITATTIESADPATAIAQLEAMLSANPRRADVRAALAEKYLATQPEKALEQYTKAAELEPASLKHRIGAGAALLKLRRFQETAETMRQVLAQNPPRDLAYFAHTNLATALFELDDYPNAAREFLWILNNQSDQKKTAITLFFLGVCFDRLGDFEQALKAYEQFLALASPENQLEIDKVKLRLAPLKRQLEKAGGKKQKKQG